MDINVSVLEEFIDGIELLNTGFTFLVNSSGDIIVNNTRNDVISASATEIPVWDQLLAELDAYSAQMLEEDEDAEFNPIASANCTIGGEEYVVTVLYDSITGWYLVGLLGEDELVSTKLSIYTRSIICVIVSAILAILVAVLITATISKELKKLKLATERMASGDLSTKMKVTAGDEFGELENNFNNMIDSISGLIKDVDLNSEKIYSIANQVLSVSEDTKQITGQVSAAIGSVAEGATEQANSTLEANLEVNRFAESIESSQAKTNDIAVCTKATESLGVKGIAILSDLSC